MALEESVGHLAWALAFILAGGTLGVALLDELEGARAAADDRRVSDVARISADLAAVEAVTDFAADTVRFQVLNSGRTPLDPSKVDVFFAGEPKTVLSWEVGGVSGTEVWPPGTHANFTVSSEFAPRRLLFTDDFGHTFVWNNPETPYVASIDVTPDTAAVQATKTLQFTATATDQFGDPIAVTPTWTTTVTGATISATGLFTAGKDLVCGSVTATSGTATDTSSVCVDPLQVKVSSITTYKGNTETATFKKGDRVTTNMVVVAVVDGLAVGDSSVSVTMVTKDPSGTVMDTQSDALDGSGVAETTYKTPNSGPTGTWSVEVSNVAASWIDYEPSQNTETVQTYELTN